MGNDAHVHLVLIHAPIAASVFAVLFLLIGELTGWPSLLKGGWTLLVVAALGAGAAFLTGEGAEDLLGERAAAEEAAFGDATTRVHAHEERAEIALWTALAAGAGGLVLLAVAGRKPGRSPGPRPLRLAGLALAIGSAAVTASAANLGGEIRHTEIREPASQPAPR